MSALWIYDKTSSNYKLKLPDPNQFHVTKSTCLFIEVLENTLSHTHNLHSW